MILIGINSIISKSWSKTLKMIFINLKNFFISWNLAKNVGQTLMFQIFETANLYDKLRLRNFRTVPFFRRDVSKNKSFKCNSSAVLYRPFLLGAVCLCLAEPRIQERSKYPGPFVHLYPPFIQNPKQILDLRALYLLEKITNKMNGTIERETDKAMDNFSITRPWTCWWW